MSFFPPDPELPEFEEPESVQPEWAQAPEDELPALLPVTEVIATTDRVAIALAGVRVHRMGLELQIERRLRRRGLPAMEWAELTGVFLEHTPFGGPVALAGRLRFGIAFENGERVLADDSPFLRMGDPDAEPEGFVLTRQGRGGGGRRERVCGERRPVALASCACGNARAGRAVACDGYRRDAHRGGCRGDR